MFTGIIEELGHVDRVEDRGDSIALTVTGPVAVEGVRHGDSIAVSGVCLTVVEHDASSFTAFVMRQTLDMSVHGGLRAGDRVNLERAARVGDRLGGHIVQGHVDGTATVLATEDGDGWRRVRFALTPGLAPLVVDKGSVALDGVSLTVSAVSDEAVAPDAAWFEVSLIPETLAATTLGALRTGDRVNVETDVLARHVRRMLRLEAR
ncbi:riboflavin synthase [Curtobacterium sp. MCBD17_034]|uniref:riboflavin synthase n=1 Tax=unclassified Curtobacterium TaxID=257496 RepID=UPI000DA80858|nr:MULTISPECIES: riboflavin synthase [unclassified Curtobacterium]PZF58653.1 riboflavin synthase [Curtobacterium sp. MCBD17_034]PZF64297.1 riboflavin synthase [Curtobacterium sp. MCBD17_013]PZM34643.1 riboflavin synthase [Curtobacterium sp. MCBD17_031]WIB62727.1 riboflavin synthase [Curtobacterium sp. MCBD17_040]WIE53725.1 riboflavin synthase [Curtobacterium sp. MCBD17_003]